MRSRGTEEAHHPQPSLNTSLGPRKDQAPGPKKVLGVMDQRSGLSKLLRGPDNGRAPFGDGDRAHLELMHRRCRPWTRPPKLTGQPFCPITVGSSWSTCSYLTPPATGPGAAPSLAAQGPPLLPKPVLQPRSPRSPPPACCLQPSPGPATQPRSQPQGPYLQPASHAQPQEGSPLRKPPAFCHAWLASAAPDEARRSREARTMGFRAPALAQL